MNFFLENPLFKELISFFNWILIGEFLVQRNNHLNVCKMTTLQRMSRWINYMQWKLSSFDSNLMLFLKDEGNHYEVIFPIPQTVVFGLDSLFQNGSCTLFSHFKESSTASVYTKLPRMTGTLFYSYDFFLPYLI